MSGNSQLEVARYLRRLEGELDIALQLDSELSYRRRHGDEKAREVKAQHPSLVAWIAKFRRFVEVLGKVEHPIIDLRVERGSASLDNVECWQVDEEARE